MIFMTLYFHTGDSANTCISFERCCTIARRRKNRHLYTNVLFPGTKTDQPQYVEIQFHVVFYPYATQLLIQFITYATPNNCIKLS